MTQAGAGVDMLVFVDIPQDMGRGVMAGYIRGVIQQHSQQQQQQHKFDFLQPFTVPFQLAVEWARANWFDGENATFEQSDTTNCPRKDRKRKRIPNCRDHVIQFETVLDLRVVVALIAGREDVVAPVSSGVVLGARREGADGGAVYADLEEEEREHDNVEADVVEDNLVVVPGMVMKNEFDPETANAYKILVGPSASEGGENLAKAEEGDGGGVEETGDDDVQEGLDAGGEGAGDAVKGEGDGEGVEEEGASKKGKKKKKKKKKTADGEDLEQVEEKIEKAVAKIERLPEVHSTRCAEILRDKQRNAHKQETLRILAYKDKLDSPTSSSAARKPAVAGGGNVAKMAAKDKEDARKRLRERIEKARPGGGGKDAGKGGKGKGKK
ncbi:hypothetical protein HK102_009572 [Quaeritorhiza haematococci]|nr:hypothetical protein HK102_009572 [Quaeritorhiza haematococci]